MKGGDYLVDQPAAEILTHEAVEAIYELERWACRSTARRTGKIDQRRFGGHTADHGERPVKRACYAADRTGHMILQTLYQQCVKRDVRFFNEFYCLDLLRTDDGARRRRRVRAGDRRAHVFRAKSVLFATGGTAGCSASPRTPTRSPATGPRSRSAAGSPWRTWSSSSSTHGPVPARRPAVRGARGEGAVLRNRDGERFMERYAPIKDLAPRDVVSRSIYQEMKEGRGWAPRRLRAPGPHPPRPAVLEEKLPDITEFARVYLQVEPKREPVPIQPTAHYAMGGIPTDVQARS